MKRINLKFSTSMLATAALLFGIPLQAFAEDAHGTPTAPVETKSDVSATPSPWSLGLQFGADLALPSVGGSNFAGTYSTSHSAGFIASAHVEYAISSVFSVQSGLRYDQRNLSGSYTLSGISTLTSNAHVGWLTVPALGKARWDLGPVTPFALVGPEFNFKMSESDTTLSAANNTLKGANVGFDFGVGAEVPVSPRFEAVGTVIYAVGLSNLASSNGALSGDTIRLSGLLMMVGLEYRMKTL